MNLRILTSLGTLFLLLGAADAVLAAVTIDNFAAGAILLESPTGPESVTNSGLNAADCISADREVHLTSKTALSAGAERAGGEIAMVFSNGGARFDLGYDVRPTLMNLAAQGSEFDVSLSFAEPGAVVRITLRDAGGGTGSTTATTGGGAETLVLPFSAFASVDLSAVERIDVLLDAPDFGDFSLTDISVSNGAPPPITLANPAPIGPFTALVFPVTLFSTTVEYWESGTPVDLGNVEIILEQPDGTPFTEFEVANLGTGIPRGASSTIARSQVSSSTATFPASLHLRLRSVFNPSSAPGIRRLRGPTLVTNGSAGFALGVVLVGPDLPENGIEFDIQFEVSPLSDLGIGNLSEEDEEELMPYPVDFTLALGGGGGPPPPAPGDPIFTVHFTSQEAEPLALPMLGPIGTVALVILLLLAAALARQVALRNRPALDSGHRAPWPLNRY